MMPLLALLLSIARADDAVLAVGDTVVVDVGAGTRVMLQVVEIVPAGVAPATAASPVYVGGHVVSAGAIAWREGLTVTQAITTAGGWKSTGRKDRVSLLRDGAVTEVPAKKILAGKVADVVLMPGDQVIVPEAIW